MIAITALALGVRLFRLDARSLWLDEILTSQPAHLGTPGDVIAWSAAAIDQMPVFYLGTWFLGHWGDNPVLLRLPAVVEGTLIVPAVYLVARRLFGTTVGLIAALLAALMPFMVWYSQEARNYSLFMLLTTLQAYFAFTAIKKGRAVDWAGLAACSVLNLYTHYLALVATAAFAVYIAAFLAVDFFTTAPRAGRDGVGLALIAVLAGLALLGRHGITAAYGDAAALFSSPTLHSATGVALLVVALVCLAAAAVYLRRRSRTFKLALAGNLLAALMVSLLALRYGGLTPPGGHPPLRYAVVPVLLGALTAIAAAVVLLDLVGAKPAAERRLRFGLITGAVVALAYAPWIPTLQGFLTRPNQTIGKIHVDHPPNLGDLAGLLSKLGLTGLLLVALLIGIAILGVWLFRRRAVEKSGLMVAWTLVPLAMFIGFAGRAIVDIDYRYLSFLMPAAIIAIAVAIEQTARLLARGLREVGPLRFSGRWASASAVALVLLAAVVAQTVVALAQSYTVPKEDYRAVAQRIAAGGPDSVVLTEGAYSDWTVICLDYYFRQLNSNVMVSDGLQVNSDVFDRLQRNGPVWGVVIFPSGEQIARMTSSPDVEVSFVDATRKVWLVRAADTSAAAIDQALLLLRWEMPLEPQLSASLGLLDLHQARAQIGADVLPAPPVQGWTFGPGTAWQGDAIALNASGPSDEVAATATGAVEPGRDYAVRFEHREQGPSGAQHVFVLVYDAAGNALATFPDGGGYACAPSDQWQESDFAFAAPPGAATAEVLLRLHGPAQGSFRNVSLGVISDTSS